MRRHVLTMLLASFFWLIVVPLVFHSAQVSAARFTLICWLGLATTLLVRYVPSLTWRPAYRHPGLATADPEPSRIALRRALRLPANPTTDEQRAQVDVENRTAFLCLDGPRLFDVLPLGCRRVGGSRARAGEIRTRQAAIDRLMAHARHMVGQAFMAVPGLTHLSLGLFQTVHHPNTGHPVRVCVLAVTVDRATWEEIVHCRVTAENALRSFQLRFSSDRSGTVKAVSEPTRPTSLEGTLGPPPRPVGPPPPHGGVATPVENAAPGGLDWNDDGGELATTDGGVEPGGLFTSMITVPALMRMDPLKFEELVKDLFMHMGFQAELTQRSHDGGIDVVVRHPDPTVDNHAVVQCKRYGKTIGSPPVRDLYGVVAHTGATKGIFITTSTFSPDARSFAEGKNLELIDGAALVELLRQYEVTLPVNSAPRGPERGATPKGLWRLDPSRTDVNFRAS